MFNFVTWLKDLAEMLFIMLSQSSIGLDHTMLVISYIFSLVAVLLVLVCCLWLVPLLFKAVISIFRRI